MKKKSLLIVAILTFVLSFAFAACGETETPHVHEYGAYTLVEGSMPTETEAGKATATCSCGETTTVDVPKLTDSTVWTLTTTDATCTVDGKKEYTSVYGKVDVTIPAAHKLGTLVAATESTCKTQGNVAYYECEACGKYFAEDGTTELTAEQILKTLAEHAYGTLHEATEPTCFSEGNVAYYECAVCKKYFDADHNEITSYVIEKTQHNFGEWQKGDENGHTRACQNEGCTETEVVPHDYEGGQCYPKNDDEHRLYCTVCNYEHLERHEFGEWEKKDETDHKQTCAKCTRVITEAHVGGTATCKEKAVCTVCHEPYGNFAEHVLGADGVCTVCGKTPNAVFGKTYSAFTVNASGTVNTSVNALLTFDANGKAEGVTGSVGIIKKNGQDEEIDPDDEYGYYTIGVVYSESAVYIRYVDKEKGTIQFVSSYKKATETYAGSGKYGTPKLTETTYDGYITATNGFIFIPQGNGDHIVLVPTDTPVTTDLISAVAFSSKGNMYGRLFIKYTGTEAHTVYYDGAYGGGREVVTSIDATVTDFDGAEVAPAAIKTAKAMIVKDKDGKVLAKYGYDGTSVIELDEWAGKYEGELGTVTVWGNGKITLPNDVEGVYTAVADKAYNIEVRVYNSDNDVVAYYEVTADNTAYTYIAEQPEATVTYDLGDYGTGSIDAKLKGITYTLAAAPTPTSDAVIFKGWVVGDDEETVYAAGAKIVLTGNTTVTAVWASKTKINIVNEKGENQTIYAGSEDILSEVLKAYIPTAAGEEFNYWAIGGAAIDNESIVGATELTVPAVWKKKYTITVVYGNGLANATETYFENATPDLTKPGFTNGKVFDGWFTDAACETVYTPEALSGDTLEFTVYAKWITAAVPFVGTSYALSVSGLKDTTYNDITLYGESRYYVTVDANGLVTDSDSSTFKNQSILFDSATNTFTINGYTGKYFPEQQAFAIYKYTSGVRKSLSVYFLDATAVPLVEPIKYSGSTNAYQYNNAKYLFLKASVTRNGETTPFTMFVDEDNFYFDIVVEKGTKSGDTYNYTELTSFSSMSIPDQVKVYNADKSTLIATLDKPTGKYTLYKALGTAGEYTATVDGVVSEDKVVLDDYGISMTFGSLTGTYALNAEKTAYDVYLNSKKVYYSMTVDFEAKTATLVKEMVTISFDLNTVSGVDMGTFASVSVNKNVSASLSEYKPTKSGYVFKGWYTTAELTTSVSSLTPTENVTVYAKWAKLCVVSFSTAHGTVPESYNTEQNTWADPNNDKLEDTDDYAFYGWYVEGYENNQIITGRYKVTDDTTFIAVWKEKVTLTIKYLAGETEVITAKTVKIAVDRAFDLSAYKPTDEERGNYVFRSFYKEGDEAMTAITDITVADGETATVVAKMEAGLTLTVKYQDNKVADKAYVVGSGDTLDLGAAKAATYADGADTFFVEGLYTDNTYATAFTATSITESTTVYAKWVKAGTYTMVSGGDKKGFDYNAEKGCWVSNNAGKNNSSATLTITAVDGPIVVTFSYACGGEGSYGHYVNNSGSGSQWWDYLIVKKGTTEIVKYKQGKDATEATLKVEGPITVKLNAGETLVFTYIKDNSTAGKYDYAHVVDLTVNGAEAELTA